MLCRVRRLHSRFIDFEELFEDTCNTYYTVRCKDHHLRSIVGRIMTQVRAGRHPYLLTLHWTADTSLHQWLTCVGGKLACLATVSAIAEA